MNKIYLVIGYSRESYDDSQWVVDAFTSKELAQKCANGWEDTEDYLLSIWDIKRDERDKKIAALSKDSSEQEYDSIYEEYEQYECWMTCYYSVKEIDLIN